MRGNIHILTSKKKTQPMKGGGLPMMVEIIQAWNGLCIPHGPLNLPAVLNQRTLKQNLNRRPTPPGPCPSGSKLTKFIIVLAPRRNEPCYITDPRAAGTRCHIEI